MGLKEQIGIKIRGDYLTAEEVNSIVNAVARALNIHGPDVVKTSAGIFIARPPVIPQITSIRLTGKQILDVPVGQGRPTTIRQVRYSWYEIICDEFGRPTEHEGKRTSTVGDEPFAFYALNMLELDRQGEQHTGLTIPADETRQPIVPLIFSYDREGAPMRLFWKTLPTRRLFMAIAIVGNLVPGHQNRWEYECQAAKLVDGWYVRDLEAEQFYARNTVENQNDGVDEEGYGGSVNDTEYATVTLQRIQPASVVPVIEETDENGVVSYWIIAPNDPAVECKTIGGRSLPASNGERSAVPCGGCG